MNKRSRYTIVEFSLLFLSLNGFLSADEEVENSSQMSSSSASLTEEKKQEKGISRELIQEKPPKPKCVNDSGGYFVGSFLYWKTDENLNLVYQVTQLEGSRQKFVAKPVNFDYEPGFKLGMGYRVNEQAWDFFVNWTWLRSYPHLSVHSTASTAIISGLQSPTGGQIDFTNAAKAKAQGKFTFDSVDIELGKEYLIGKRVSLRPFAGIKTAWVNQNVHIKFVNPVAQNNNMQNNNTQSNVVQNVLLPDIKEKLHQQFPLKKISQRGRLFF